MQAAVFFRQHGGRRIVAHRAHGLLGVDHHGMEDEFQFLGGIAHGHLAAAQRFTVELLDPAGRGVDRFGQRHDLFDPLAIVLAVGQQVLDLAVVIEPALGEIDGHELARTDAALFDHLRFRYRHHAGFRPDDQHAVRRHGVAHRPETVAVHAGHHPAAVGGADGRRTVPGLHDAVAVIQQRPVGVGFGVAVRPGVGDHQHLGHRRVAARPDQRLEDGVEGG